MKTILLFCFFAFLFSLSSCTPIDKASKDAARIDNQMNAGDERIIRRMDHYEG